jgi:hypothetical protein
MHTSSPGQSPRLRRPSLNAPQAEDRRIFRVDGHLFRVDVDRPDAPVQVLRDGAWHALVLSTQDLLGLMSAPELTAEEIEKPGLPFWG